MRTFVALLLLALILIAWINAPLTIEGIEDLTAMLWIFTVAIVIALGR